MVVMRLVLMGWMGKHGRRRMLTVMVMVVVSGGDHGVAVGVLAAAVVIALVRRWTVGRSGCVQTQQLLNGER